MASRISSDAMTVGADNVTLGNLGRQPLQTRSHHVCDDVLLVRLVSVIKVHADRRESPAAVLTGDVLGFPDDGSVALSGLVPLDGVW